MVNLCRLSSIKSILLLATIFAVSLLVWWNSRLLVSSGKCSCPEHQAPVYIPTINNTPTFTELSSITTKIKETVRPSTEKPVINSVDFKFVYPDITPDIKGLQDIFLIVYVNSAAKGHRDRRDTIRKTWGSHDTCEQQRAMKDDKLKDLKWMLVFVVGKSGTQEDQANIQEAKEHNDMLIGDIVDNYINNIVKVYMGLLWSSNWAPKYLLKTDDDVYIRIPSLIEYFVQQGFPKRFYGGETYGVSGVFRGGKWGVSKKYYPEPRWPRFNCGSMIAISSDLVGSLFNYITHIRVPFHTDDAYIGVAMRDFNVTPVHIPSFTSHGQLSEFVRDKKDCEILALAGFSHNFGPKSSPYLHGRLEALCKKNVTTKSCLVKT